MQIEHFVDPKDKKHPKFPAVADKELVLFGRVSDAMRCNGMGLRGREE